MHSLSFCLRPENIRAVPAAYYATWLPHVSVIATYSCLLLSCFRAFHVSPAKRASDRGWKIEFYQTAGLQ